MSLVDCLANHHVTTMIPPTLFTYSLGAIPPKYNNAKLLRAVRKACDAWERIANIKFSYVENEPHVDINISFGNTGRTERVAETRSFNRGEPDQFFYVVFEQTQQFYYSTGLRRALELFLHLQSEEDLIIHMMHELGHVLGLQHSEKPDSIMYSSPGVTGLLEPSVYDEFEVLKLYPF